MSYNIDSWNTIELKDLSVPLDILTKLRDSKDFWADLSWSAPDMKRFSVRLCESCDIRGWVDGTTAHFDVFAIGGAGSGRAFSSSMLSLLSKTTGELKAFIVWEGGDIISLLHVRDGRLKHKNLDPKKLFANTSLAGTQGKG